MRKTITGLSRRRQTRKSVHVANFVAEILITAGGIVTIVAVLGVFAYLLYEVMPLFASARISQVESSEFGGAPATTATPATAPEIMHIGTDVYRVMGWTLTSDGAIRAYEIATGVACAEVQLTTSAELSAISFAIEGNEGAIGLASGEFIPIEVGFRASYVSAAEVDEQVRKQLSESDAGHAVPMAGGMVQMTQAGQYRLQQLEVVAGPSRQLAPGKIERISWTRTSSGPQVVGLAKVEDQTQLFLARGAEKEDFLTGKKQLTWERAQKLEFPALAEVPPSFLQVTGDGNNIYLAWNEGTFARLNCVDLEDPFVAESGRLIDPGRTLTSMVFTLGNNTLVYGDSQGRLQAGFLVRRDELTPPYLPPADRVINAKSRFVFMTTRVLGESGSAVTCLAPSSRSRLMLSGHADGGVRIWDVTAADLLATAAAPDGAQSPVDHIAFAPKADGMLAMHGRQAISTAIDPLHPDASLASLFTPVWYEGYAEPMHTWQSSSGHASFEPKLGMMPLIFGTIKATFYSMLFGAPLALLAAIYTSEFLHVRTRARIKPTIELMASLPSVVLGFLAALVIAPFVESRVMSVLLMFITVPSMLLLASFLWQLLPRSLIVRWSSWRLWATLPVMAAGVLVASVLATPVESWLFGGDFRAWLDWSPEGNLDGDVDLESASASTSPFRSPVGGFFLLCLPVTAALALMISQLTIVPILRRLPLRRHLHVALLDLARFVAVAVVAFVAALAIAFLLGALGFDTRGGIFDTYVQRNALVVGFIMGFAIIPIIYTIADDALSAVPDHLRSASLGAGATQWQTAWRVVIPTAMSGLFSAMMIGLGRAVGETMIVLMATGNTPVMDWNVFEGFRTLSANIAVEMPEAVAGSTHYRTLFLAALVLFALTFIVNTIAEIVRLRFRKRAYQL